MRSGLRAMGVLQGKDSYCQEPVALETAVIATGARPGDSAARRELFTEETQTVLVLEHGAVIRLSAAVADGQLLFLTNKKTGKEVVTQVIRKRSFRPTSCYVDLEFTEASPGFWGIDFPQASSGDVASISGDETSASEAAKPAPPPDLQEIHRLKQEVSELQMQLKSLTEKPQRAEGATPPFAVQKIAEDPARKEEDELLQQLLAQEAKQDAVGGQKPLVAYPRNSPKAASVKAADRRKRMIAAAALLAVASGVAVYRFGLLEAVTRKSPPAAAAVTQPPPQKPGPAASGATAKPGDSATNAPSLNRSPLAESSSIRAETLRPAPLTAPEPSGTPKETANAELRGRPRSASVAPAPFSPVVLPPANPEAPPPGSEEFVAPKLLRAVRPVSPPDALRNYVTGNVNVEALVDSTGHVKTVTILSGPQKLRTTAVQVMQQYLYEPARKNGKPVSAHVHASLQFWYEP